MAREFCIVNLCCGRFFLVGEGGQDEWMKNRYYFDT